MLQRYAEKFDGEEAAVSSEVSALVYLVTPLHAARLLENNACNRAMSEKTVSKYAKQMTDGKWQSYFLKLEG